MNDDLFKSESDREANHQPDSDVLGFTDWSIPDAVPYIADTAQQPVADCDESGAQPKSRRRGKALPVLRTIFEILLVLALVGVCIYAFTDVFTPYNLSVTWYTPNGSFSTGGLASGTVVALESAPEIEGYTFIGWRDAEGNIEKRKSITVYDNMSFSAVYSFALDTEDHVPYMLLDSNAYFRPNDLFTRGEAAIMIYRLLNTDKVGTATFLDVAETDRCCTAVATLKELGVISGSRFHPEDPITRGELLDMLAAFCPSSSNSYEFSDLNSGSAYYPAFCAAVDRGWIESGKDVVADPDGQFTRLQAAVFMNSVLGRGTVADTDYAMAGTFFDVSFSNPDFWQAAEASIPHEYALSGGSESWTSSEALKLYDEGFFFIGVKLYYAGHDGSVVTDDTVGGLSFGPDGAYTSGNAELDTVVVSVLSGIVNPGTMEREEMLKIIYDYCSHSFKYLRRNYYDFGETGFAEKEAYTMLTTGKGNCYNFASAFYALSRAIGYDSVIYSGKIKVDGKQYTAHSWVEIEIDGETFIFDPEMEYAFREKADVNMYKLTLEKGKGWGYQRP